MKKTLLFLTTGILSVTGFSQTQIENGGFEGPWENVTGTEDEPQDWSSLKTADALASLAPIVAFQETTDPHSGTYCVKLENTTSFGVVANGMITNGRVHADFNPELGYIFTVPGNPEWELPMNGDRPDSLVGWYKFAPVGGDKAKFEMILHDNSATGKLPESGSQAHWVARARFDITSAATGWTRFAVPFGYYNSNSPVYGLIVINAGDSTQAVDGSIMYIDDISLVYNPNILDVSPSTTQNINVGANGTTLTATETQNAGSIAVIGGTPTREWLWTTTSGSGYASFGPAETGLTYTPNFASPGIYYVVCETDFGTEIIMSPEVTIIVTDPGANSVTVTPATAQTLLVGQDGNLLTATENPGPATSREWLWSTTSGSGYASFAPMETGLTYLPNFAALGTYYVVCESDFAGDVQISNEVTIYVPSAAGIADEDLEFSIYNENNLITINLNYLENAAFMLFSLDGKEVFNTGLTQTTSVINAGDLNGMYVYRIVTGDKIITGKLQL